MASRFHFDLALTGGGVQGLLYELPQASTILHLIENVQTDFPEKYKYCNNLSDTPDLFIQTCYIVKIVKILF